MADIRRYRAKQREARCEIARYLKCHEYAESLLTNCIDYYIIIGMNKSKAHKARDLEEKTRNFKEICRKHGMKITPQRIAIYKELFSSKKHPSASAIYRKIKKYYPSISLGTVNSTLLVFSNIRLAKIVESSGDPKRFDPNLEPHHHFKCIKCGKIVDFQSTAYDHITVPAEINRKFVILEKKVHLEGLCDRCRKRS